MAVVDLTMEYIGERVPPETIRMDIPLRSEQTRYTGVVYKFINESMSGSYIDFPGHIAETDNGEYADNFSIERVYRVPASVIRMHCRSGHGAVSGEDLEKAFGGVPSTETLIINALGELDPRDVENRSVYLDHSAIDWIIASGCRLLMSDIYESQALHGVFPKLFGAGITTVCMPVNLNQLPLPEVKLTVLFSKIPGVTQLPCRIVAEF